MPHFDGVLMLGFGGPTPGCCKRRNTCSMTPGCEAECFVSGILGDHPGRQARVTQVVEHYKVTGGGFSPYDELTRQQAAALAHALSQRGLSVPVAVGYRHWTPWVSDAIQSLADQGCRNLALVIMAPHQSSVSWDWYLTHTSEALDGMRSSLGDRTPEVTHVASPFFDHPGFISASAATLREATRGWSAERVAKAHLVFTAHAVPQPVERSSAYRRQFAVTAEMIATAFVHPVHEIAFQSAPEDSRIPWSSPTIIEAMDAAKAAGAEDIIVQAAGFLVDHTEVLFDLDHEAAAHAKAIGLTYVRARCVHDHPDFIGALADRLQSE